MRMRVRVECHAGYKGAERPVRFFLDNRCYQIFEILDRWYEPEDSFFKVLADDGNLYILRHTPGMNADLWTLQAFRSENGR